MAGKKKMTRVTAKLPFIVALAAMVVLLTGLPEGQPLGARPQVARAPASAPLLQKTAAQQPYAIKGALTLDGPLKHGSYAWNDEGVPQGEILITVDLAAETLSIFRAGYEIGVAAILYGADDKQTPLGAFSITEKKRHHISNLYGAPMPYMLRLTNDGVAIHASAVEWGSATHGCIGVPPEFARLLFEQAGLGTRVLITKGQMLQIGDKIPTA